MNQKELAPGIMPLDRASWYHKIHLSNFINTYCQFRDIQSCGGVRNILEVGSGQGLTTQVLRWKGYDVTTFDIDRTFEPDYVGSIHDLHMFEDGQFDAVIASHVLEHLPVSFLDKSLEEIARVARYALVYLPIAGRHFHLRLCPGFKGIDISIILDFLNPFTKPDGLTPKFCQNQHFWEVGMRGFKVHDLKRRFAVQFDLLNIYRNRDWNSSINFVLSSRRRKS